MDPGVNESGDYSQKSIHASKHGSPQLRKTLFQIMDVLIKTKPDGAVYLFMDRKRAEGKSYYVYMTAGANKFLRVYYGRVREYLASLDPFPTEAENNGIPGISCEVKFRYLVLRKYAVLAGFNSEDSAQNMPVPLAGLSGMLSRTHTKRGETRNSPAVRKTRLKSRSQMARPCAAL